MEEILHQLIGSLSHYLQGFIYPRWCRISSFNSIPNRSFKSQNFATDSVEAGRIRWPKLDGATSGKSWRRWSWMIRWRIHLPKQRYRCMSQCWLPCLVLPCLDLIKGILATSKLLKALGKNGVWEDMVMSKAVVMKDPWKTTIGMTLWLGLLLWSPLVQLLVRLRQGHRWHINWADVHVFKLGASCVSLDVLWRHIHLFRVSRWRMFFSPLFLDFSHVDYLFAYLQRPMALHKWHLNTFIFLCQVLIKLHILFGKDCWQKSLPQTIWDGSRVLGESKSPPLEFEILPTTNHFQRGHRAPKELFQIVFGLWLFH